MDTYTVIATGVDEDNHTITGAGREASIETPISRGGRRVRRCREASLYAGTDEGHNRHCRKGAI
jgi:hypothetical protein